MTIRNESAANETMAMRASVDALERARWAAVLGAPTVRNIKAAHRASRLNKIVNGVNVFSFLLPAAAVLGALAAVGGDIARALFV